MKARKSQTCHYRMRVAVEGSVWVYVEAKNEKEAFKKALNRDEWLSDDLDFASEPTMTDVMEGPHRSDDL